MEYIDAFTHVLPRAAYEKLGEVHPTEEHAGFSGGSMLWDIEKRLADMDEFGIDKQVIMLALPSLWRGIDRERAREVIEVANDEVHRIAEEHPDRFIPVGTLPLLDEEYEDEYERCIDDLGMAGVQIFANVDGRPLDDPNFRWLFERAEREGVPLWLHPQLTDWYEWDETYLLNKILGWPFDTSMAQSRLVFGGVMESHPDLEMIVHHMGAMIPHFVDRIQNFYQHTIEHQDQYPDRGFEELSGSIEDYYRQFNVDTSVSGSRSTFECSYEFYGPEQVVFGTDYPFGPGQGRQWIETIPQLIEEMDVPESEKEQLFNGNIRSLIE